MVEIAPIPIGFAYFTFSLNLKMSIVDTPLVIMIIFEPPRGKTNNIQTGLYSYRSRLEA